MAAHRNQGPVCQGSRPVKTRQGTMCLAEPLPPASIGIGNFPDLGADLTVGLAWVKQFLLGARIYWGVDSATAANALVGRPVGPHHRRLTLYDHVTSLAGRKPDFWGRYIGGHFALSGPEVQFLHARSCSILVIYNGTHDSTASVRGGFAQGVSDAENAIRAAQALGVPAMTYIYADIESGWSPTADWFKGWSDTMADSSYGGAGGVYANPLPANAPHFNTPYCQAFTSDAKMRGINLQRGGYVFSSEPEPGCGAPGPARFAPAAPPCNPDTVIWQYAENCFGKLADQDLANDVGLWSMWW